MDWDPFFSLDNLQADGLKVESNELTLYLFDNQLTY